MHILGDAILVLRGQLSANPEHDLTKREALFILAHTVGDIHQPLHVGAAYIDEGEQFVVLETADEAQAGFTQGGNFLCHGTVGVHSYWDDRVVTGAMKKAEKTTSKTFAAALVPQAKKVTADPGPIADWPAAWATESLNIASQELSLLTVIDARKPGKTSPWQKTQVAADRTVWDVEFPGDYQADAAVTAREQLTKAGAGLARLLKAIWP